MRIGVILVPMPRGRAKCGPVLPERVAQNRQVIAWVEQTPHDAQRTSTEPCPAAPVYPRPTCDRRLRWPWSTSFATNGTSESGHSRV
jgi:hypothetical protein